MTDTGATSAWRTARWPLCAAGAAVLVYGPITANYFHADDFLFLYKLANYPLAEVLLEPTGGHLLTVRSAVFALTHAAFGLDPRGYFWTVLLTHLANVLLLYHLLWRWTASTAVAGLAAIAWATVPFAEGALGWYSVYGQVMVATILLLVLGQVARIEATAAAVSARRAVLWGALWLVAACCFGVGVGLAIAFPAAVTLLLPGRLPGRTRLVLWALPPVIVALYLGHLALYHLVSDSPPLVETELLRTMTYGRPIAAMLIHLVAFGVSGLVLGAIRIPGRYPDAPSVAIAIAVAVLFVVALATAPAADRRRLLACALLMLAAYGTVALGRGGFWSLLHFTAAQSASIQRRLHYAASVPATLVLGLLVGQVCRWLDPGRLPVHLLASVAAATLLLAWAYQAAPIDHHDAQRRRSEHLVAQVVAAVRTAPPGADVRLRNAAFLDGGWLETSFPGTGAAFTIFFPDDTIDGHRIRFVAENPGRLAQLRPGTRAAALYLAPDDPRAR